VFCGPIPVTSIELGGTGLISVTTRGLRGGTDGSGATLRSTELLLATKYNTGVIKSQEKRMGNFVTDGQGRPFVVWRTSPTERVAYHFPVRGRVKVRGKVGDASHGSLSNRCGACAGRTCVAVIHGSEGADAVDRDEDGRGADTDIADRRSSGGWSRSISHSL